MIKREELRIGNLVLFEQNGDFFYVKTISEHGIDVYNQTESTWIEIDQFSGIPLTPEWLERFGFKDSYAGHYLENPTQYNFVLSKGTIYYNTIPIKCEYVHTLQNLYFALTGTELELKP